MKRLHSLLFIAFIVGGYIAAMLKLVDFLNICKPELAYGPELNAMLFASFMIVTYVICEIAIQAKLTEWQSTNVADAICTVLVAIYAGLMFAVTKISIAKLPTFLAGYAERIDHARIFLLRSESGLAELVAAGYDESALYEESLITIGVMLGILICVHLLYIVLSFFSTMETAARAERRYEKSPEGKAKKLAQAKAYAEWKANERAKKADPGRLGDAAAAPISVTSDEAGTMDHVEGV